MLTHFLRFTLVTLLAFSANAAQAEDLSSLIGQKVYPKANCKIMNGRKEIDPATVPTPYVVQAIQDDWLDIGPGYVLREQVLTILDKLTDSNDHIRRFPDSWAGYCLRARVWEEAEEWDFALEDRDKSISLCDGNIHCLNEAAWLLATCPIERIRDGKRAVELARIACKSTADTDSNFLDTLAAAYAEAGDFQNAFRTQRKATALAPSNKKTDFESRLKLYEHRKPYRQGEPGVIALRDPSELPPIAGVRRTAPPATIVIDEEQTEAVVKRLGPTRPQGLPPTP